MQLFRVFDWNGRSLDDRPGGPLFVNRERQGAGRHDIPALSGVWYLSQSPVSAIAETLQYLRGHTVASDDFARVDGTRKALASLDLATHAVPVDLDDPRELTRRRLRPSLVATRHRPSTQAIARTLFETGAVGFSWWSVLEASWVNVTLFEERAHSLLSLAGRPQLLSPESKEVREAAEYLGIQLK